MRFPAYAETRQTGRQPITCLPSHWDLRRLRFLAGGIEQGWSPQCDNLPAEDDGWGVMKVGCVNGTGFDAGENKALPPELEPLAQYELRAGDVLVSRANTRELVGSAALVPEGVRPRLLLCDKLFRLSALADIHPRFLVYLLRTPAARFHYEREATGASGSMQSIGQDTLKDVLVPIPPVDEQEHIAKFLDWKTGQIDALIAKKHALLARLRETEQTEIQEAVCGVGRELVTRENAGGWLPALPRHWDAPPLKYRYSVDLGKMLDSKRIDGTALRPYLRNVDVQWDRIRFEELPEMDIFPEELDRYTVRAGDVLVCEGGDIGRTALVPEELEGFGYQKALHRLRPLSYTEHPRFLYYTMRWAVQAGAFAGEGASTIAHLTAEQLREYRFPRPPKDEQRDITARLDFVLGGLNALVVKTHDAINRLTEYRAALITAAVAGQIDVRRVALPA